MKQQNLFLMVDTLSKVAPQYFKILETLKWVKWLLRRGGRLEGGGLRRGERG